MRTATVQVVDASALAALLFGEPAGEEVGRRLGDSRLIAPSLLTFELGNTCWKKIRRHPALGPQLLSALSLLGELDLTLFEVEPPAVLDLALRRDLTFYDAAYLWLARSAGVSLVTLDARLAAASA